MSYILDALKKSERERQRGAVPDVMTGHEVAVQDRKKRLLWPYLLTGALILNAGFLVWWLGWHSKGSVVIAQPAPAARPESKPPVAAGNPPGTGNPASSLLPGPASTNDPAAVNKSDAPRNDASSPEVPRKNAPVKEDRRKNTESSSAPATPKETRDIPVQASQATVASVAQEPQPIETHPAPVKNKLYSLKELPPSIQQGLPDFAISTHLFSSDTASRMVRINGQSLREGGYLSAGLKLEEITADGVIFSYQNFRFRIGLK